MAEENKLNIEVEVVNKATAELQAIRKQLEALTNSFSGVSGGANTANLSVGKLAGSFALGSIAATAITTALSAIKDATIGAARSVMDMGMQAARIEELEFAMQVMGQRSGMAAEQVFKARDSIVELNVSRKQATQFVNELIRADIDLAKSNEIVRGAQDLAVVSGMDSAEALGRLAQALRTGNTFILDQLVNLPNLAVVYDKYGSTVGKTANELTQAEKSQAVLNAFMFEASKVTGLYETSLTGASKASRSLMSSIQRSQETIGQLFLPALNAVVPVLQKTAKEFENWLNAHQEDIQRAGAVIAEYAKQIMDAFMGIIRGIPWETLGKIFGFVVDQLAEVAHTAMAVLNTLQAAYRGLVAIGQALTGVAGAAVEFLRGNMEGARAQIQVASDAVAKTTQDITKDFQSAWDHAKASQESFTENFKRKMSQVTVSTHKELNIQGGKWEDTYQKVKDGVGKKIESIAKKIADENKNFMRSMEQSVRNFDMQLRDLVVRHRDAANQLRNDINSLVADYNQAELERSSEHEERNQEIQNQYEEEVAALKDNLGRQLADRHRADEDLVRALELAIEEKERKRNEELAKEEARFVKETEKAKKQHEQRLTELQKRLNEEMEIQKKHADDFAKFKDAQVEDDITRLKNSFAAEMDERRRQHTERLEELKKEYEEIAKVKSTGEAKMSARSPAGRGGATEAKPLYSPTRAGATSPGGQWSFNGRDWVRAHEGAILLGNGEVPVLAQGGEAILSRTQTAGLFRLLESLANARGGIDVTQTNYIREQVDMDVSMRELGWKINLGR